MTAGARLARAQRAARRRALASVGLYALPWFGAALVLALRPEAGAWRWLPAAMVLASAAWLGLRTLRRMDRRWLARALDASRADMEDSADLLLVDAPPRSGLPALQRLRLQQRLERGPAPDLRPRWDARRLAIHAALGGAALVAVLLWPASPPARVDARELAAGARGGAAQAPRLVARQLQIHPPAYTGLPVRRIEALSAKVPAGSELRWTLRFAPDPDKAALMFHDGNRLALTRNGDAWSARRRIDRATLYRIEPVQPGATDAQRLHRIDTIVDRAPRVRVVQPARTLSTLVPGQRRWTVAFEASDDYGLAANARLRITRTEGSGENITAREQAILLRGSGSAVRRRYAHGFDLAALGLVAGDDLIVQLVVSDRRAPKPHTVASPSLILRWPPELGVQASGLDGLMKKVMPAYFRSQRQIIIDAEALLQEKPRLAAERFVERSDGIGVDQRLLRLRYGQFLGEESEGAPQAPLPTSDLPATDAPAAQADAEDQAHTPDDGHDHGDEPPQTRAATFGEETQVLERFGHTHDIPEAATLLDPSTRALLRSALDEMWQSELNLRTGAPERALPYAYRALDLIKRVQQSERIYLARVGPELPPIDQARRLKGDRAGLADRGDPVRAAPRGDQTIVEAWRALAPGSGAAQALDPRALDALARRIATQDASGGDPLALAAAIEALRRDPRCRACRERLRTLLWPLLARPPAAPGGRAPRGREGDAYLDALRAEAAR